MLLKNFLVESNLVNGSIGTVISLHFSTKEGPRDANPIGYAICDFPDCTIPESDKLLPGAPRTHVPIPMFEFRCDKKCCLMMAFPLRVCKAITGHKSQGMTIAKGEPFEMAVVHLPEKGEKVPPGWEMVTSSRAKTLQDFCYGNNTRDLNKSTLRDIGKSAAHDEHRAFQDGLKRTYRDTKREVMESIAALDPSGNGSYREGCMFLLKWYRNEFWNT